MTIMVLVPGFDLGLVIMTMMHMLRRGMSYCLLHCVVG